MKKFCKNIIQIFIIAMLFFSITKQVYATETSLKIGDINGDGEVNSLDRIQISQHIAASRVPEIAKEQPTWILKNEQLKAGDINGDGTINPLDRTKVSEYIAATRVPEIAKENPTWKTYIESKWEIEATSITLDKTSITLEKGKTTKLVATIEPSNVTNKIVTWSSSDTKVATVDGIGNIDAKETGIAIITATTKNGKNAKCEVKVTETQPQPTTKATPTTTTKTPTPTPTKAITTPTKNIANLNIALSPTQVTYNGKAQTPSVTIKDGTTLLKNGTNFTLAYSKNINAGTATITITGKGNYTGTTTKTFKINKATYNMNSTKFANSTVTYNGKAHSITATGIPAGVKVTYIGNGKVAAGTYTITAKFTGNTINYNTIANKTAILRINPKSITTLSIAGITDKEYTGKAITQNITIKDGNTALKNGINYTVTYTNNVKAGRATVVITGKGNYTGKVTKYFNIIDLIENQTIKVNGKLVTKAQYANFRNVSGGKLGKNVLYRCINPIHGTSKSKGKYAQAGYYADQMLREHKVKAILNLDNDSSSIRKSSYPKSTYYRSLFNSGKVCARSISGVSDSKSWQKKIVDRIRFFAKNEGPYAVHCWIGRDRTGFTIVLLECLMDVPFENMYNDYKKSDENFRITGRFNENTISGFSKDLKIITGKSAKDKKHPKASDWKNVNFSKCAERYLKGGGMSDKEIQALKNHLSKNY